MKVFLIANFNLEYWKMPLTLDRRLYLSHKLQTIPLNLNDKASAAIE